ncbi:outer membrane receptor protein involved in Fe transport [Archangium gephyra]|uniref:Outer membrane receptor protein involved in Fe transport n=1 Tax=Archangium gephyra TaxID=48 RepID=A0AAC8TG59_9BACT|nr:TonB-dependent receptor [Archangium gephyra]AKJ04787.1 Trehalose synthase [Archangium gephyra]REG37162.1 outer membrane receptor protein involved in Fe transport [Archangium gephyra]
MPLMRMFQALGVVMVASLSFSTKAFADPPAQTVQVNEEPSRREVEEVVLASCEPSTLDGCSTSTSQSVEREFTQHLAVNRPPEGGAARSFESLAGLVPGTQSEMGGFSIHGASPAENRYLVDGLSTGDAVSGFNASPLSVEFLQDFQVITGGYMPQYGRATGGILQARTRSGSNEFHGSLFGTWAPGFLEGLRTPISPPTSVISTREALQYLGDAGATLGGPLVKDKLWFFAGVAPALSRSEHTRTAKDINTNTPIPGSSRSFSLEAFRFQAVGKLTYLFHQDHNVALSIITTPGVSGVVDSSMGSVTALEPRYDFTTAQLQYAGAFLDKRLTVDARLGWSHQMTARQLVAASAPLPPIVGDSTREPCTEPSEGSMPCPVKSYEPGSSSLLTAVDRYRYQGTAQATWLLQLAGTHVLRAGVDGEFLTLERDWGSSGGVVLVEGDLARPNGGDIRALRGGFVQHTSFSKDSYTSNLLGGFVQDSWTLFDRVTVNAGFRYDTQWLYRTNGLLAFALRDQLSPRLGVVVDPMGQGRMKLFAHYAKYQAQLPLGVLEKVFPPERSDTPFPTQASDVPVDPDIRPLSSTELVAGAGYEVLAHTRLSAHYTHRRLDSAIEDMGGDEEGRSFFLGNPGLGLGSDYQKAERTYDGLTLVLSRTFRDGWLAQASYTWSRLHGNYVTPYNRDGTPLQPDFDSMSLMRNRSGLLPYDRTHSLKLFGARELHLTRELSASLGLSYLGCSGTPINYLGNHWLFGQGNTFILARGSTGERTPWIHVIDSNVGVNYRLGEDKVLSFTLDVFNLFNFQAATRVDELYTNAAVLPLETPVAAGELTPDMIQRSSGGSLSQADVNPGFKQPLQYQPPRQVRLGLRYTF